MHDRVFRKSSERLKTVTFFQKSSIIDVWQGPRYASALLWYKFAWSSGQLFFPLDHCLRFNCRNYTDTIIQTKEQCEFEVKRITTNSTNPYLILVSSVHWVQSGFCNESYNGDGLRHLNVRIGEHIGILTLTKKTSSAQEQLRNQTFTILQPFRMKASLKEGLWIGTLHRQHSTYSTRPSNKIICFISC